MNKYDVEYNRVMRKMERGGSISAYAFEMQTPTGKPSKLSYIQQLLVRTTSFKEWFGDWEKASKVYISSGKYTNVEEFISASTQMFKNRFKGEDESIYDFQNIIIDSPFLMFDYKDEVYHAYKGVSKVLDLDTLEPRVVYHGTKAENEFYTFRTQVSDQGRPYAYFAYNKEYSQNFSRDNGNLYECFLNVKDPYTNFDFTFQENFKTQIEGITQAFKLKAEALNLPFSLDNEKVKSLLLYTNFAVDILDYATDVTEKKPFWYLLATDVRGLLKKSFEINGYDGVMFGEELRTIDLIEFFKRDLFTRAIVVFNPNQVKLADGRNVDFFESSDDIRYDDGGMINDKVLEVIQNYSNEAYKPYFMVGNVVVRIKDHLANWNNFERINMGGDSSPTKFLSIVIANDPNNDLLRESNKRVESFEERNEDEDLIAREYIYSPTMDTDEIISDIDYYISKMQQGKTNFERGGNLEKEIMLPDSSAKYAHLKGVLKKQGFDIYPSIKENQMEKFEVGGTIKHEKGTTTDGKKGGYFEGRPHSEGGIKAFNVSTNTPIEVEGGEVIITKKAVDDDELKEFEGEMLTNREILSRINQSGGGVAFEDGGEIHSCNCSGNKFAYGGETIEDYEIIRRLQSSYETKENMKNHKIKYGHNLMRKMKQGGFI
jgi:hypothetical protein